MSGREAARRFGISRDSVRKMLSFSVPPGYQRKAEIKRPKLDGFTEIVDAWLAEDQGRNRKQRHTAKRVLERLRDEHGFTGGYTIIKDYMRERERQGREMFVPLAHPPGHAQADFGEATVVIGGVERQAHFFALDLPHSDACYVRAYPAATSEAWVDGHVHAFAFFGRVPISVLYDNDRCLVAKILPPVEDRLPDGTRKRAKLFSGFLSHYLFRDRYGRPGKGNDKGNVGGAGRLCPPQLHGARSRGSRPGTRSIRLVGGEVPRAAGGCPARPRPRRSGNGSPGIWPRWPICRPAPFDACDQATGRVNSQALVRYRTNDYSVPVAYGHRDVWIRGYVDEVVIGCGGEVIARHPRCYDREDMVFDPVHYLPLIEKKINALDQAAPLAEWDLPPEFADPAPPDGSADDQGGTPGVCAGPAAAGDF